MKRWQAIAFIAGLLTLCGVLPSSGQVSFPPAVGESVVTCSSSTIFTNEFVITAGPGIDVECDGGTATVSVTGGSANIDIRKDGTLIGTRPALNFIQGSGMTISCTDDAGNNRVNCSLTSTSGTSDNGRTFIACTGNITSALLTAFNASEPVSLGPGACTVTAPFAPSVAVIDWRGSNMARTDVTFTAPAAGRCGFERLPGGSSDGLSQSYISDMTFIMTGTARDTFCIAGLSNGTVFRNVDFRSGKTQMKVTPAASDNSVCFRCEFDNIFGGFGNTDSMFIFDGNSSSFLLMTMNMLDIHNNSGAGGTLPLIEIAGMSDELSHVVITGALFDTGGATAGLPVIDVIDAGNFTMSVLGAHMANGSTAIDFVRANSDIAFNLEAFNADKDPSVAGGILVCGSAINYVAPATATDVSCSAAPGMPASVNGRPLIRNGRLETVP